ncbi:MAG: hypothetical protein ACXAC8_09310 [Candidatus Hodarchaeales archaeon]|jgi:hypothetical protein
MTDNEKSKKTNKLFKKLKESGRDFVEGVKEEIDSSQFSTKEKTRSFAEGKASSIKSAVETRIADTSTPEEVYFSTWAWFWVMIFSVFICLMIFIFSLSNSKFLLMGLLALIAIPFLIVWCLIHMIPTIKIFGFTIFDRHQLSLRRQLSVGKEIARFFSREFLQESPLIAFLLFSFILIFIFSVLVALL